MTSNGSDDCESVYAIVRNIPPFYHSKDLRRFFSKLIESGGFQCFHFRHRPEIKATRNDSSRPVPLNVKTSTCCIVKLSSPNMRILLRDYHDEFWKSKSGDPMPYKCLITRAKIMPTFSCGPSTSEVNGPKFLTQDDLADLIELKPPSLMPQGNVGTPTRAFLELIRSCRLPPAVVKNLGLVFPKTGSRRIYSQVPMEYECGDGTTRYTQNPDLSEPEGRNINDEYDQPKNEEEELEEATEEWDRHEALHDDVTSQERTKPRLYEEEQEVVWEKGGPGLVFYTDDFYWESQEPDTDAQWADDWDVDMSVYQDEKAGDKDSRDFVAIRREQMLRSGQLESSVFSKKSSAGFSDAKSGRRRRHSDSEDSSNDALWKFAKFEDHSKGVGRKVLEGRGWTEGRGLGVSERGKPYSVALDLEGQPPHSRKGFGYYGEKIQRYGLKKPKPVHLIGTKYDNMEDLNSNDDTLCNRRTDYFMKYRNLNK